MFCLSRQHGRPRVTEPTLQQWIGDSAAIPCTPEVQAPRAKKKSPRWVLFGPEGPVLLIAVKQDPVHRPAALGRPASFSQPSLGLNSYRTA